MNKREEQEIHNSHETGIMVHMLMNGGALFSQQCFLVAVNQSYQCQVSNCVEISCFDTFTGRAGGLFRSDNKAKLSSIATAIASWY